MRMNRTCDFLKRFARNRLAAFGLGLLAVIVVLSLIVPWLPLADPNATNLSARLQGPFTAGHLLGTDQLGRDILSRIVWGTRVSLAVGLLATFVAALVGSTIGIIAGYYGRLTDNLLMRGIDIIMAFPYMLSALAIVAILGPGLMNALIAISVVNIPFFARNVRGATVGLVELEYVDAALVCGRSNVMIIIRELLPNVVPVIIITISTTVGWMILETAGLSFLGLGAQPPQADLGSMLGEGRKMLLTAPHVSTIPGIAILLIVISINLMGDGLRDVLDPRLKGGSLASPAASTKVARSSGDETTVSDSESPLLEVDRLSTWFRVDAEDYRAVDEVSFRLQRGESLGIMGESGSGKSVTALSLMKLVATPPGEIISGRVQFDGQEIVAADLNLLQMLRGNRVAYIFQNPLTSLNPLLTVGEQLVETISKHQRCSTREALQKAEDILRKVQIPSARSRLTTYPHELSGGMRQRVSIAMALVNHPEVIIADEPTTALDVTIQAQILKLMQELQQEYGLSLIFISHDFGVISEICDRVLVMYAGQIVEAATVEQLYRAPLHPYTQRLMACVPRIGDTDQELAAISGLPPSVNRLPRGCYFADRCDQVLEACRREPVDLREFAEGRAARCIRVGEF